MSADWLAPAENPSRVVLGVIVTGALLAAESGLHDTYLETFASGALAAALYWLAHAYADVLGRRLRSNRRLTAHELGQSLIHEGAVVRGAAIPLVALLIAAAAGADRETGVDIAVWTAAGSIVVLELVAGLRSRATRAEIMIEAAVGIVIGLGVIALKALLAH
jgi:VIT1/CCC1 family predicted Fe2+/Mn2+ transporter